MYIYCVHYMFHDNFYSAYFFADSLESAQHSVEYYIPSNSSIISVHPLEKSDCHKLIVERDNYLPPDSVLRDLVDSYLFLLAENE